jgi:hypothetical protein
MWNPDEDVFLVSLRDVTNHDVPGRPFLGSRVLEKKRKEFAATFRHLHSQPREADKLSSNSKTDQTIRQPKLLR